jgi:hypothetical protein
MFKVDDVELYDVGDLVKNHSNISWRNQDAMGVVVKCKPYPGYRNNEQDVFVKWIYPHDYHEGTMLCLNHSLELVANGQGGS